MDDRALSEIRDMLDQGIAVKKTREQVNQGFRDVADAFNFFSNASTEAARHLEEIGAEFRTVVGDLFADDDIQLEADSFNCVVSSYALCHGRLESEYEGLYARIRNWIKPGGCFLCLDHVHGSKAELTMLGFEDWAELLRRNFPEDRVESILKNSLIEDSPLDIPHHLSLLSKVGFERVDVLWKKGLFALYGGFGKADETRH